MNCFKSCFRPNLPSDSESSRLRADSESSRLRVVEGEFSLYISCFVTAIATQGFHWITDQHSCSFRDLCASYRNIDRSCVCMYRTTQEHHLQYQLQPKRRLHSRRPVLCPQCSNRQEIGRAGSVEGALAGISWLSLCLRCRN